MTCLIIDDLHEILFSFLEKANISYDYQPNMKPEQVIEVIRNYEGVILRSKLNLTQPILEKANKLKFIGRVGAGLDNIDLDYCEQRNIPVFHASEGNRQAVAEHAIGMLLCLWNKLHTANQEVRQKQWRREENRGIEIADKTIGIIGYGNIGKTIARCLSGFGCNIIAYDKNIEQFSPESIAQPVTLEQLFEQTDILTLHIPLTAETKNMVNLDFFRKFKKNITFINTARGEIVVLEDLLQAISENKVQFAALDVLENEKINQLTPKQQATFQELVKNEQKILLSPHVAGWTFQSYRKLSEVLGEKIYKHFSK